MDIIMNLPWYFGIPVCFFTFALCVVVIDFIDSKLNRK